MIPGAFVKNMLIPILFAIATACCWGLYVLTLLSMGMALGLLQLSNANSNVTSSIAIFHRPDIPSQFAIGRNDTEPSVAAEKQDHQDCPLTSSMFCHRSRPCILLYLLPNCKFDSIEAVAFITMKVPVKRFLYIAYQHVYRPTSSAG